MSNPLNNPLLSKATLLIPVPSAVVTQDSDGNWITNDSYAIYLAYFKKPGKQPEVNNNPGTDGFSVYLKGYLIDPLFLPSNLKLPIKVECTRNIGKREQKGTFEIRPSLVPVELVEGIIGQAIEGWFWWHD